MRICDLFSSEISEKLDRLYKDYLVGYYSNTGFHLVKVSELPLIEKRNYEEYYLELLDYEAYPDLFQGEDNEGTCQLTIHEILANAVQKIDSEYFVIDADIAEVVRKLNTDDFRTEYSCRGHLFDIGDGDIAATGPYVSFYTNKHSYVTKLIKLIKRNPFIAVDIAYCTDTSNAPEWNVVINPSQRLTEDFLKEHDNKITEDILQVFKYWIEFVLTPAIDSLIYN